MSFGKQLFVWRKAKGKTQQQLADGVGVNVSYISNLERDFSANTKSGKPRPSVELCDKIAKFLEVDVSTVRVAAGYASTSPHNIAGFTIDLPDDVEMVIPYTAINSEADALEFQQAFMLTYELVKARLKQKRESD